MHETDHQTSLYVWVWSSPAHWHINGRGTTPKRPPQAACSCKLTLSQRLGSFPIESRAVIYSPVKTRLPSSTPINRSRFHVLREKKIELKVGRKPAFPAHFSCNRPLLCFLSPPWLSATAIFITRLLSIIPTSSSHQTISRGGCTTSLSLSPL